MVWYHGSYLCGLYLLQGQIITHPYEAIPPRPLYYAHPIKELCAVHAVGNLRFYRAKEEKTHEVPLDVDEHERRSFLFLLPHEALLEWKPQYRQEHHVLAIFSSKTFRSISSLAFAIRDRRRYEKRFNSFASSSWAVLTLFMSNTSMISFGWSRQNFWTNVPFVTNWLT